MGSGAKGKGKDKEPRERKKPGRVPTSCAECRRLKLRCDRNVPCEKCVSRGCGSICPDGSLTPGKGGRLILANTEELHEQIDRLRYRNRELESALRQLQEGVSDEPHPLLRTDVLQTNFLQGSSSGASTSSSSKSPSTSRISPITHAPEPIEARLEEDHSIIDAFGTMTINRRGHSAFLGRTARPEFLLNATLKPQRAAFQTPPRISKRIMELSFPESQIPDTSLVTDMLSLLPSQSDGLHFCDVYLEYGKFVYTALPRKELLDEIFSAVYRTKHLPNFEHFHALSLLFIVFALATLFNPSSPPYAPEGHEYFYLSRAAFNLSQPFWETTPTTIQTLIHTAQYVDLSEFDASGHDSAWAYVGQAVQLGYSIGLHLDASRWKLSDEVVQRRQELFWHLFVADTWANFHIGRPPRISKSSIDCPQPQLPDDNVDSNENFQSWFTHYTLLLHSIMESALGPKQPIYSAILDFDRKIRDVCVPSQWRMPIEDEPTPPPHEVFMYRWLVLSAKETALLNLHRMYLGQALQESPADLHRHRYVPSAVAVYRSAWRLIHCLAVTWRAIPKFLARVNVAWSHGLSAALVMCLLVTRSPTSHLTTPAMEELDNVTSLFDAASSSCRSAAKILPSIQVLRRKAHESVGPPHTARFYHHPHHDNLSGSMGVSSGDSGITIADLDRLNGKTHLFSDMHSSSGMSNAPTPMSMIASTSTSATSTAPTDDRSRATSHTDTHTQHGHNIHSGHQHQPPMAMVPTADDNLHPTLAQDVREFTVRSSVPAVPRLSFYDHPSELQSPVAPPPTTAHPPPPQLHAHGHVQHQQGPGHPQTHAIRQTPPEPPRLILPPYHQPALSPPQTQPQPHPPPQMSTSTSTPQHQQVPQMSMHMHMSVPASYYPPPQPPPAPYVHIPGFQSGFAVSGIGPSLSAGGFGGWNGASPFVLDSSWNTLVEQLGF
ncbi:unnamed protein product [Cyclocybe aegerita]|uniref:Zn(2)-C6 fungal-type domain-containing protein n=1 Tax=Cyclocybe aegerita TaxID=1973307 RepID=A0A8S0X2H5_CYCAE|nr:unnamed protein product [Cyclocybe aegerita]